MTVYSQHVGIHAAVIRGGGSENVKEIRERPIQAHKLLRLKTSKKIHNIVNNMHMHATICNNMHMQTTCNADNFVICYTVSLHLNPAASLPHMSHSHTHI